MKTKTVSYFAGKFVRKHWIGILFLILLLWLLPKIINVMALLFQSLADLVVTIGNLFKLPALGVAKAVAFINSLADRVLKVPILPFLLFLFVAPFAPMVSAVLGLWSLLDFFKPDETITINRRDSGTPPAPGLVTPPANPEFSGF